MAVSLTLDAMPSTNYFTFEKKQKVKEKIKPASQIEEHYGSIRTDLEAIELPSRFTAQTLVDGLRELDEEDPERKKQRTKQLDIQDRLGYYRSGVHHHLTHKTKSTEFPELLWGFLQALGDFYEHIKPSTVAKRDTHSDLFYISDLPSSYFTTMDLEVQAEEMSIEVLLDIINKIKIKIIGSPFRPNRVRELEFIRKVSRKGKARIKRMFDKYSRIVDSIFEKMDLAENNRFKVYTFVFFWNVPENITSVREAIINKILCKNFDSALYEKYYTEFKESVKDVRKYLSSNFHDIFSTFNKIEDKNTKLAWNEMVDCILYA